MDLRGFVEAVRDRTRTTLGERLAGCYLVGSLATGDAQPGSSDVDVLIAVTAALGSDDQARLADAVLDLSQTCPWAGIEYVVYRTVVLAAPRYPLDYELNVNGGPARARHVSSAGDPPHWFLLDVAMAREHAVALHGPPAATLIGAPPPHDVETALRDALSWHAEHDAGSPNAVLNACRAWHFFVTGRWLSKIDAGRWALGRAEDPGLVEEALGLRADGTLEGLDEDRVRGFLDLVHAQGGQRRS